MTWIRSLTMVLAVVLITASSLFVGYLAGTHKSQGQASQPAEGVEGKEEEATAKVKVATARAGEIEQTVMAFGTVVASPEDVTTISVPFECRVRRVLAVAGQAVTGDDNLIDIEPSPDALLTLSDARNTFEATGRDLAQVQQRLELKLATKAELSTAEQALTMAKSKLESLQKRHIEPQRLSAGVSGLVNKVDVQEGQIVSPGGALVEVVAADRVQVKLGVEPSLAGELKPGQNVRLQTVQGGNGAEVDGTLRTITQRVNPASRLVDVYVALPANSPLKLETFVRARIIVATRRGLLVPRWAVLPEGEQHVLFTVIDGKAKKHQVEAGLEDRENIELAGKDVHTGDRVVIEGNAELEDGMAVEVEEDSPTTRAGATTVTRPADGSGS